jgi:ABC-type transport system substrate-binding protein
MVFVIPNFVHPDPRIRALVQDRRFRRALSMLIDRESFGGQMYGELAEPVYNWNDREGYNDLPYPRFNYAPAAAYALFEELGLRRDGTRSSCPDGCYVLPDGTPLVLKLSHFDRSEINEGAALMAKALQSVGLEIVDDPENPDTMVERVFTRDSGVFREFDLWYDRRGGALDGREFYGAVFDVGADYRYWGIGPAPGVAPSDVQAWEVRLSELSAINESKGPLAERVAAAAEATVIFAEELPMIPVVLLSRYQAYVGNLANTLDQVTDDYSLAFSNGDNVQLLFFR